MLRTAMLIGACLAVAACSHSTPDAAASVTPIATECQGKFTRDQIVGTWNEADSPAVYTLNANGSLVNTVEGQTSSGTWNFTKWSLTPGTPTPGDGDDCVLWLKIGSYDYLYAPLDVTGSTLKLSYMDRGNTIVWNRSNNA